MGPNCPFEPGRELAPGSGPEPALAEAPGASDDPSPAARTVGRDRQPPSPAAAATARAATAAGSDKRNRFRTLPPSTPEPLNTRQRIPSFGFRRSQACGPTPRPESPAPPGAGTRALPAPRGRPPRRPGAASSPQSPGPAAAPEWARVDAAVASCSRPRARADRALMTTKTANRVAFPGPRPASRGWEPVLGIRRRPEPRTSAEPPRTDEAPHVGLRANPQFGLQSRCPLLGRGPCPHAAGSARKRNFVFGLKCSAPRRCDAGRGGRGARRRGCLPAPQCPHL